MKESMDYKNLMKYMITQLLLSVSIFSLVFSYSSLFSSSPRLIYSQKMNYYFSLDSFDQLLSRAMNKNYIFLICNTLLFVVAKTSGFVNRSPYSSSVGLNGVVLQERVGDDVAIGSELTLVEKDVIMFDEAKEGEIGEEVKIENDGEKEYFECLSEETKEVSIFIPESDDDQEEETREEIDDDQEEEKGEEIEDDERESSKSCCLFHDEDDDDDDDAADDETEMMSTEELNQKFEDFIRRMKEEIRFSEARQQLVVVN